MKQESLRRPLVKGAPEAWEKFWFRPHTPSKKHLTLRGIRDVRGWGHATFRMEGTGIRMLWTEIMLFLPYASGSVPLSGCVYSSGGLWQHVVVLFLRARSLSRERLARTCSGRVWASVLHEETPFNAQFIMHNAQSRCTIFQCTISMHDAQFFNA